MELKACTLQELTEKKKVVVIVNGRDILLVLDGKDIRAFNRVCPHARGDLVKGIMEPGHVTCINHGLKYNLESGRINIDDLDEDIVENMDPEILEKIRLATYTARIDGDDVILVLSD